MSRRDIEDDSIWVTQEKTEVKPLIPLHPTLRSRLAAWPKDHVVILTSSRGRPFSAASFGNWMAKSIAAAGLSDECTPHGLRRTSARRLAEAGCSAHEIMAVTGHRTLAEVQRYTKEVEQKRLAQEAIKRLGDRSGTKTP